MLRIYTHEDCVAHQVPEHHPERPARLSFLIQHLERTGFTADYPLQVAPQIGEAPIALAHHAALVRQLTSDIPAISSGKFISDLLGSSPAHLLLCWCSGQFLSF